MNDVKQYFANRGAEAQNRPLRELLDSFVKFGFKFNRINSNDKRHIYKVDTGKSTHYEVFEHRINKFLNCVSYPTSDDFGNWAKCTSNYERAKRYFTNGW